LAYSKYLVCYSLSPLVIIYLNLGIWFSQA
jgi:hypothetical protein